uniref:ARAD1C12364p n=1 Tax=Blastobotrys adeninivorans TaxID=409370 RepID=A0A060T5H8_BLAAD
MVSIKTVVFGALTASYAMADARQDFFVQQASRMAVDFWASNRASGVPESQASSEAAHIFDAVNNYSGFSQIINEVIGNGGVTDKGQIAKYVSEADQAYNQFSKGPQFAPFTSYVKAHEKDFDIEKAISSAKSIAQPYSGRLSSMFSQFTSDPQGKEIASSAGKLVQHVASDVGLDKYVKNQGGQRGHRDV